MHKLSSPLELASGTYLLEGSGNPEGAVTAPAGSLYFRSNGEHYRKVSGSGNTGWRLMSSRQEFAMWHAAFTWRWDMAFDTTVSLHRVSGSSGNAPTIVYSRHTTPYGTGTVVSLPQTFTAGQTLSAALSDMGGSSEICATYLFST